MALKRLNLKSLWCFLLEKSRLQSMPSSEALQTRCTVNQSKEFGIRLDDHDKDSLCMIMMCLPFQLGDLALRVCEGLQRGVGLGQLSPQPPPLPPWRPAHTVIPLRRKLACATTFFSGDMENGPCQ